MLGNHSSTWSFKRAYTIYTDFIIGTFTSQAGVIQPAHLHVRTNIVSAALYRLGICIWPTASKSIRDSCSCWEGRQLDEQIHGLGGWCKGQWRRRLSHGFLRSWDSLGDSTLKGLFLICLSIDEDGLFGLRTDESMLPHLDHYGSNLSGVTFGWLTKLGARCMPTVLAPPFIIEILPSAIQYWIFGM